MNSFVYAKKTRIKWREAFCCCFKRDGVGAIGNISNDDSLELSRSHGLPEQLIVNRNTTG